MTPAAATSTPAPDALAHLRDRLDGRNLVFFDGSCVMCNGFVLFAHHRDRRGALRFAPLDGESFRFLAEALPGLAGEDSMVLLRFRPDGSPDAALRSSAALGVLASLGGFWAFLARLGQIVPRPLRDAVYRAVAALRHKLFGRYSPGACPLPPPDLTAKLLP